MINPTKEAEIEDNTENIVQLKIDIRMKLWKNPKQVKNTPKTAINPKLQNIKNLCKWASNKENQKTYYS